MLYRRNGNIFENYLLGPNNQYFGGKALKNGNKLVKPTKSMKKLLHKQEFSDHVLREFVKFVTSMAQIHIL